MSTLWGLVIFDVDKGTLRPFFSVESMDDVKKMSTAELA
jgi:hypothetical protein